MTLPTAERCRELAKEHDDAIADCLARGSSAAFVQTGVDAAAALRWAATVLEGMGRERPNAPVIAEACWHEGGREVILNALNAERAAHQAEVLGLREHIRVLLACMDNANAGAFLNGNTHGDFDEGDVLTARAMDAARDALKDPTGVTAARAALEGK